jgi:hypothetical protein
MSVTGINNNLKSTDNMNCYLNGNDINSALTTYVSILTEGGKEKEDIIRVKEAKIMFNDENQLLCSNNLSLEMIK